MIDARSIDKLRKLTRDVSPSDDDLALILGGYIDRHARDDFARLAPRLVTKLLAFYDAVMECAGGGHQDACMYSILECVCVLKVIGK